MRWTGCIPSYANAVCSPVHRRRELLPAVIQASLRGRLATTPLNRVLEQLEGRRLHVLLTQMLDIDSARSAFRVLDTETPLETAIGGLSLSLRVDRIDELATGEQLVIDYKTGRAKSPSDWLGARPAEPQLPVYAVGGTAAGVAFIRLNEDGVKVDGVAGVDMGLDGIHSVGQLTRGQLATWNELVTEWKAALAALAQEFAAGCCHIDALAPELAGGQYAPLTRVHDGRPAE
jgi:ATP-dependent helicase/nuclease subunit B